MLGTRTLKPRSIEPPELEVPQIRSTFVGLPTVRIIIVFVGTFGARGRDPTYFCMVAWLLNIMSFVSRAGP